MQAEVVREWLSQGDFPAVEVRPALCFSKAGGPPLLRRLELEGVIVASPRGVAKLARRPGPLGQDEVQCLLRALATALTPA